MTTPADLAKYQLDRSFRILPHRSIEEVADNIDELSSIPTILFLNVSKKMGHWVAIFQNQYGINWFDSNGMYPDDVIKVAKVKDKPKMRKLIQQHKEDRENGYTNKRMWYNQYKLQKKGSTNCGLWCILRLVFYDLSEGEFANTFRGADDKLEYMLEGLKQPYERQISYLE